MIMLIEIRRRPLRHTAHSFFFATAAVTHTDLPSAQRTLRICAWLFCSGSRPKPGPTLPYCPKLCITVDPRLAVDGPKRPEPYNALRSRSVGLRNLLPGEVQFQLEHLRSEKGHRTGAALTRGTASLLWFLLRLLVVPPAVPAVPPHAASFTLSRAYREPIESLSRALVREPFRFRLCLFSPPSFPWLLLPCALL